MRSLGVFGTVTAALAFAAAAARAEPVLRPGDAVNGPYLSIEGVQVPLPAGPWTMAGLSERDELTSAALLRVEEGPASGAVLVQVSSRRVVGTWGLASACYRDDLPYVQTRAASDHDGSCAWVARVRTGPDASSAGGPDSVDPAWEAARRMAAERGWGLPAAWTLTGIRVSQPQASVQVRYALPQVPGPGQPAALWAWTAPTWDAVERGLHNLLDPAAGPLPSPLTAGLPLVGKHADTDGFSLSRAIWKTITFRVIGTTIDFTTNMVATGSIATSLALSSLPLLIGPWIYFGHEIAWQYWGGGTSHRDLPGLGIETGLSARAS